jgi:hypothetical protein
LVARADRERQIEDRGVDAFLHVLDAI